MPVLQWKRSLLFAVIAYASVSSAFQSPSRRRLRLPIVANVASTDVDVVDVASPQPISNGKASPSGACYYRRIDGPMRPRKELNSLFIGERLFATRLPKSDLFAGKSGPKVFFECGVGVKNTKGKWKIANGMYRIGRRGMKASVVRKKVRKLPADSLIEVYVSKIMPDHGCFEVCLNRKDALEMGSRKRKIPASSLKTGEEMMGTITRVTDYGLFVDVSANRNGLIHISKVAKQQNKYIAKGDGLKEAGLGRGSSVNVVVLSNDKKRLELDLAPPPAPAPAEEKPMEEEDDDTSDDSSSVSANNDMSEDEAAAWAAYAAPDEGGQGGDDTIDDEAAMWAAYAAPDAVEEDDDDEYDEDGDIEDSLGIGSW